MPSLQGSSDGQSESNTACPSLSHKSRPLPQCHTQGPGTVGPSIGKARAVLPPKTLSTPYPSPGPARRRKSEAPLQTAATRRAGAAPVGPWGPGGGGTGPSACADAPPQPPSHQLQNKARQKEQGWQGRWGALTSAPRPVPPGKISAPRPAPPSAPGLARAPRSPLFLTRLTYFAQG